MQKDFITVTPDSGTGDAIITVEVEETNALQNRESSLNISTSGISRTVSVTQEAALPIEAGTNYNAIIKSYDPLNPENDNQPYVWESSLVNVTVSGTTVTGLTSSTNKTIPMKVSINGAVASHTVFKYCKLTISNYNTNPVLTKIEMSQSTSGLNSQTVFVGRQGITCIKGKLTTPIIMIQFTDNSKIAMAFITIEFYGK